ncbi:unnamed protein product [Clavelina lepadiformis]|uniref:Transporter n=1 Tax=Clavelina lepadiformis TaxID=159417 RepID=A0ABP0FVU9_CLALP
MAVEKSDGTRTRGHWKNKREFLLACTGYAVGLGNIWRFPYLCFKSGGGAFLIPYLTMLIVCGIPLLYLEMAVGQLTGFGPIHAIGMLCPMMKGVGIATVVISFILCTYYNVIISWALYYLFNTFQSPLPWYSCESSWSSDNCRHYINVSLNSTTDISATQDFFDRKVLSKTTGIRSAGKVVYVTATFPYLILFVLLGTSFTLPGASKGIYYFFKPEWQELLNVKVWVNAAAQNFNSIGIGFGSMIAFASYNRKDNNLLRDTLVISCINSLTSIIAGLVIFSAMGHMSYVLNRPVANVTTEGPELVFIVYPQLFANLPVPQLWAFLFFLMLVFLGIDSQFAMVEVAITSLADSFKGKLLTKIFKRKELLSFTVCFIALLLGVPNLMQGGIYVFTLLDNYTAVVALMFLAFFEVVTICWIYGARQLSNDVKRMTGSKPPKYMTICWLVISPILIGTILIFSIVRYEPAHYGKYNYPVWADAVGWLIALCSMVCIPATAVYALCFAKGSLVERLMKCIRPQLGKINVNCSDEEAISFDSETSESGSSPPHYESVVELTQLKSGDPAS